MLYRSRLFNVVGIAVLACSLQACTSLRSFNPFARRPVVQPRVITPATDVADANLREGRRLLEDGLTGAAIDAFRRALTAGERVAPAVNGLGVAYARLGRYDLAQRYFAEAAALEPLDARYAANLRRLDERLALAEQERRNAAALAAAQDHPASGEVQAALMGFATPPRPRFEPPASRLRQVSAYEVRIDTMPPQAAPAYRPMQRALAAPGRPPITVTVVGGPPAAAPIAVAKQAEARKVDLATTLASITR